ncbi:Aste57867_21981 [Aphanomyces stellatus]|uniref:Aste57867_21981 protein n=1 Tax=Aphanomyces stellatus TaxID=120398 RepID=A0A485LJM2_9STRA|nr:hypothetical protein As57867_021912 [Aphanomyces stellatus]VFT98649.1 Aste57867_21981 [Aphanomyces stellatus]
MGITSEMLLCRFVFNGAEDDEPISLLLPSDPSPTLKAVRSHFPFEGRFHFRLQEATSGGNYVWRDLVDDETELPTASGDVLFKVLQLSSTPEDYPIYSSQVALANEYDHFQAIFRDASDDRPPSKASSSKPPHHLNALWKNTKQQLNKTSAKVWETVEFTAGRYFGSQTGADKPSAAALQQLAAASSLSRTMFSDANREHMDYLRRLWVGVVGDARPIARPSPAWVDMGFPLDDPVVTLKTFGVLGLHALVFFGDVHRSAAQDMRGNNYAYAAVGLAVMGILTEVLDIESGRFLERDEVYWKLFEDPIGLLELFSVSFHAYDTFWKHAKQTRAFQSPLDMTRQYICRLLMQGPKSVEELVHYAHDLRLN